MNWKNILFIVIGLPLIVLIIGVVITTSYVFLDSTGILNGYDNYLFQKKMTQIINTDQKEIYIKDLTEFDWDMVCLYLPYEYNYINENKYIEEGDGLYNIEFKHLNKIILLTKIRRRLINEDSIKKWPVRCFDSKAVLIIKDKKIINIIYKE